MSYREIDPLEFSERQGIATTGNRAGRCQRISLTSFTFIVVIGHRHGVSSGGCGASHGHWVQLFDCESRYQVATGRGSLPELLDPRRCRNYSHQSARCQHHSTCAERLPRDHPHRSGNSVKRAPVRSRARLHYAASQHVPWRRYVGKSLMRMRCASEYSMR
jgi:hypothetical protein